MSAMSTRSQLYGRQIGAAAWRVDALDLHDDGVAEPQRHARLRADEHRLLLVELPPVAAEAPDGQQALVPVAEGDERTRADHADDLPGPFRVPAELEQLGLEQE